MQRVPEEQKEFLSEVIITGRTSASPLSNVVETETLLSQSLKTQEGWFPGQRLPSSSSTRLATQKVTSFPMSFATSLTSS